MLQFDPLLYDRCRTMVCRNTPHLYEFCDRENCDANRICAGLNGALEEWLKLADHLGDHGCDLIDHTDSTMLPIKSYMWDYVSCHVPLRLGYWSWEIGPHDFCAEFRDARFIRAGSEHLFHHTHSEDCQCAGRRVRDAARRNHKINRQPVFIDDRKIAELGEGVKIGALAPIDSMVTLKPLHDCNMVRGDFSEPFSLSASERLNAVADRELDTFGLPNVPARVPEGKLVSEMVERRSQVVKRVSKNERAATKNAIEIGHMIDEEDTLPGIRIELDSETWSVAFDRERLPFILFQGVSVLFRLIYLEPAGAQRGWHDETFGWNSVLRGRAQ